jgi:mono/diheme cytochrome c family protein
MQRLLLAAAFFVVAGPLCADPHTNYLLYCRGCHLADGTGVQDAVPSLVNTLGQFAASPEGREYLVRVPGVSQTPMSDEQLAAVLNWVMTEFNNDVLPQDHRPYTAEEVRKARTKVLEDPLRTRAAILSD